MILLLLYSLRVRHSHHWRSWFGHHCTDLDWTMGMAALMELVCALLFMKVSYHYFAWSTYSLPEITTSQFFLGLEICHEHSIASSLFISILLLQPSTPPIMRISLGPKVSTISFENKCNTVHYSFKYYTVLFCNYMAQLSTDHHLHLTLASFPFYASRQTESVQSLLPSHKLFFSILLSTLFPLLYVFY